MQLVLLSLFVLGFYSQSSVPSTCAPCVGSTTLCCSKWGYCGIGANWCGPGCLAGACYGDTSGSTTRSPTPFPTAANGGNTPSQPKPQPQPAPGNKILTASILQRIMGTSNDLSGFIPHIQNSLDVYNMNTPLRIAAFLAQVRHETAGLTTFYQPADNGAGAIHMLPYNFRMACRQIPALSQAFSRNFPTCVSADKCDCGDDVTAGRIVAMNETSFLTGGWWMAQGSKEIMGWTQCGDLRLNCDQGLGAPGMPGTGYYEVSRCIFGNGNDGGLQQRLSYYTIAKQALGI